MAISGVLYKQGSNPSLYLEPNGAGSINVLENFTWTHSRKESRKEVVPALLTEYQPNNSQLLNAIYYFAYQANIGNFQAASLGNTASDNINAATTLLKSSNDPTSYYHSRYVATPTGFNYILPYFGEQKFQRDNTFAVDSIAENWPANVKSGGFGYSSDMVISAYMGMRQNGVNASGKINYRYDSLVHFTNGWGANFSDGMSWLNGKTPQGNATIKIPDGVGSYSANNTIFYFKEGQCKLYYSQNLPMSISSLVAGAGNYDWPNVSNVVSWTNTWGFYTHVFFDFKNWRYFSWEESCASGGCLTIKLTMSGYKSLDKLLKWPAGWGKQ